MTNGDSKARLDALRELLGEGSLSTQDELREKLEKMEFAVTQSTISRDLRKLGAVKAIDPSGQTVYRLPDEPTTSLSGNSLRDLVIQIKTNGSMIAIKTTPGSASLVARHLDYALAEKLLGTIAGDDTVFVAPASLRNIRQSMQFIQKMLGI